MVLPPLVLCFYRGTKSIGPDKAAKIYRCLFQRRRGAAGSAGGASRSGGLG